MFDLVTIDHARMSHVGLPTLPVMSDLALNVEWHATMLHPNVHVWVYIFQSPVQVLEHAIAHDPDRLLKLGMLTHECSGFVERTLLDLEEIGGVSGCKHAVVARHVGVWKLEDARGMQTRALGSSNDNAFHTCHVQSVDDQLE